MIPVNIDIREAHMPIIISTVPTVSGTIIAPTHIVAKAAEEKKHLNNKAHFTKKLSLFLRFLL